MPMHAVSLSIVAYIADARSIYINKYFIKVNQIILPIRKLILELHAT